MEKNVFVKLKVPCKFYIIDGVDVDHCKDCCFFNGYKKDMFEQIVSVDCIMPEVPPMNCHVTSFEMGGYEYRCHRYDETKDGEIEGDDPYDYCQKCCFNKEMCNGNEVCLLKIGMDDDNYTFNCHEGDIWEKFPIKEIED